LPAKPYQIRKMGTRRGQPHYCAHCKLCFGGRVLSIGYLDRPRAESMVRDHMLSHHGLTVLSSKSSTK